MAKVTDDGREKYSSTQTMALLWNTLPILMKLKVGSFQLNLNFLEMFRCLYKFKKSAA